MKDTVRAATARRAVIAGPTGAMPAGALTAGARSGAGAPGDTLTLGIAAGGRDPASRSLPFRYWAILCGGILWAVEFWAIKYWPSTGQHAPFRPLAQSRLQLRSCRARAHLSADSSEYSPGTVAS